MKTIEKRNQIFDEIKEKFLFEEVKILDLFKKDTILEFNFDNKKLSY